ncbi:MAG TPA: glycerol kinase GlpK [Solirubrobacteraceae bacterium]|nr:glycerol kinase GlpK [Solirubrobacteraceae bacterium]
MILAIDQGTTGSTCLVFDERAALVGRAQRELAQHFPRPGWVEHDALEIWRVTQAVAGEALADAGVRRGELAAVGITNQRETVCVWDPDSGEPLHRAIVWQDRRTAERCGQLREAGYEPLIRERTGLVLDPYFSATKMQWLLEHVPGLRERATAGRALFGTVDSWLIHKLTGEHLTDPSNASRTLLYDIRAGRWDPELLELFGIPERALPRVGTSAGVLGTTLPRALHGHAVPVAGVAGDQQAALFGQACLEPGMGKNTYGTGSFVLLNAGGQAPPPAPGLLGTVAWGIGAAEPRTPGGGEKDAAGVEAWGAQRSLTGDAGMRLCYALEASIFVTGAAVQWLRDGLGVIADAAETETLAASLQSNEQVYFVPALTGLGSPHWDAGARGTIVGLTRGSTRAHLARATLEAIAYQTVDAVRAMEAGAGESLRELRVDGGATANGWLMQFQADVLGVPVVVPGIAETTALGAAYLAGVGAGRWGLADVVAGWRERVRYEPRMGEDERDRLLAGWQAALARARGVGSAQPVT